MNNNHLKFLCSLTVGVALLVVTFKYFDWHGTLAAMSAARGDQLFSALALLAVAYFLRGRRWLIWEPRLRFWDSLKLILVGFMGNNVLPARLGEVLRAHCAAPRIAGECGRTATLASIAIERILDGFVIALIGMLGLRLVPLDVRLFWILTSICALFFLLTAGLILGNHSHLLIRSILKQIRLAFPGRISALVETKAGFFLDGLLLVRRPSTLLSALLMTALIWGVELVSYYLIAVAVLPATPHKVSLIFLPVVNFASLFPFTVGGLGAIEGAASNFLISAGLPANESLAMVLVQHGFQFLFTTVAGGILYFTNKYRDIPLVRSPNPTAAVSVAESDPGRLIVYRTRQQMERLSRDLGIARKDQPKVELSIVIPAYNEKNRLPKTVLDTIKWCKENCDHYEIIIVDDGSTDETLEIGKIFSEYHDSVSWIANPHLGKGAAVRSGMLNSTGEHVLFMDADGATPLEEIPKLRSKLHEGYSIAIGSRIVANSEETMVVTSWHRKVIGRLFSTIVNIFGVRGIGDTQCGFKIFKAEVVGKIFSLQKLNGFAFDVEILFLARRLSLRISEVPINWNNQEGSKVNLILDSIRMLRDVLKLSFLHKHVKGG